MNASLTHLLKPPTPCLNRSQKQLRQRLTARLEQGSYRILDLGSAGRQWHPRIISLDLFKSGQVTVVADSSRLPFRSACLDFILCTAVLEHVVDLAATVSEIKRCLVPGGEIYIDVPFLQPFHADPADYRRYTLPGLRQLFQEYHCMDCGVSVGPFSGIAMILRKIPAAGIANQKLALAVEAVAGWATFWLKYLDRLFPSGQVMHKVASGVYFYGKHGR
ncbi:MAG TPA: class I SAM-dependent methyltransferase [bacterium]|nr:class I SAM-dependent methyltransferase [bacterium]